MEVWGINIKWFGWQVFPCWWVEVWGGQVWLTGFSLFMSPSLNCTFLLFWVGIQYFLSIQNNYIVWELSPNLFEKSVSYPSLLLVLKILKINLNLQVKNPEKSLQKINFVRVSLIRIYVGTQWNIEIHINTEMQWK
jgi:hypothetical protein